MILDKKNKLTSLEQTKHINYDELLKIRQESQGLYNAWLEEYDTTTLNEYKSAKLRIKNINFFLNYYSRPYLNLKLLKMKKSIKIMMHLCTSILKVATLLFYI